MFVITVVLSKCHFRDAEGTEARVFERKEDVHLDGYLLREKNTAKDGTTLFYCAHRNMKGCKAMIYRSPTGSFSTGKKHSHAPAPEEIQVCALGTFEYHRLTSQARSACKGLREKAADPSS